jgi:hypothetical protein
VQAPVSLRDRAAVWGQALAAPARFASSAALLAILFGMAIVGRGGTPLSRGAAALGGLGLLAVGAILWLRSRRRMAQSPRELVRRIIVPTDAPLGARALRAASLLERQERETEDTARVARQLAELHFERLIARATVNSVERAARRRARWYRWFGVAVGTIVVSAGVLAARELAEGFDVLVAHGPVAPVRMNWVERLRMMAQPPAYLHAPPRRLLAGTISLLPKGSSLTLRARPLFPSRSLVVTDGVREAPFVSDGEGGLVAHYTVQDDAALVIAARFGNVLIAEPEALRVVALPDTAPVVTLEGAPQTLRSSEMERLELRWSAVDDHGLEQVELVLRSGNREDRRVLASYDDGTSEQRGGHVLQASDPFLRSLYLPAEIRIEARDNDPVNGSKWGKSAAITLTPTAVGEPDALRYLALARARDGFVDALALGEPSAKGAPPDRDRERRFGERLSTSASDFEHALGASYGGLRVPPGLRNFALGRLRVVTEQRGASAQAAMLGELILALDAALSGLSTRDAQRVAKVLSEVAEEAMLGAEQARHAEGRGGAVERLDRAIVSLDTGARQLLALGALGNDLGSVALADLGRLRRAREGDDFYHAQLVARHMADRLRRPMPSFGSSGSGGVEAGQSGSSSEPSGDLSQAQREFDELSRQINELAMEHAGAVERVDQALSDAQAAPDPEALRAEAERRAEALRQAVSDLPEPGHSPGTPEAAAALAGEHGRAMAHNLESLRLDQAADSGRKAIAAMQEASSKGPMGLWDQNELQNIQRTLEEQLAWTESLLESQKQAARDKAREMLQQPASLEEELASAAARLAEKGAESATPLPSEVVERLRQADQLMRQAARDLREGEGEGGLLRQRQAQRLLETADPNHPNEGDGDGSETESGDEGSSGRPAGFGGDVPDAEERNKAEEFRRRVLESLGDDTTRRLGPAIKRYAEGLLR